MKPIKWRKCSGCGREMPTAELAGHERACKRAHVVPGDRFQMNVTTMVGGRKGKPTRRPITVEIVSPDGERGWVVRSTVSGRLMRAPSTRRFLDWHTFAPGADRS